MVNGVVMDYLRGSMVSGSQLCTVVGTVMDLYGLVVVGIARSCMTQWLLVVVLCTCSSVVITAVGWHSLEVAVQISRWHGHRFGWPGGCFKPRLCRAQRLLIQS